MNFFSLVVFILSFAACSHLPIRSEVSFYTQNLIKVPLSEQYWQVAYDGGGKVTFASEGSRDMILQPQTPKVASETFAALVLLKASSEKPLQDYVVHVEVTTVRHLRELAPNDWEVFWFMGNYRMGTVGTKETNYFLLKPQTGGELGRAYQEVGQSFLKTDVKKTLALNVRHAFTYIKKGPRFRVYLDRNLILDYLETDHKKGLYDHKGAFGLYAEDALVRIHSFSYKAL